MKETIETRTMKILSLILMLKHKHSYAQSYMIPYYETSCLKGLVTELVIYYTKYKQQKSQVVWDDCIATFSLLLTTLLA